MEIKSQEDILKVCDLLHDSQVKEDAISYDEGSHILNIIVKRDYLDDEGMLTIKRLFPFVRKYSYPLMESQIKLDNVVHFRKHSRDTSISKHTFNDCLIKDNVYILRFCEVLTIEISFLNNQPLGIMKDIGFDPNHRGSSVSFSWKP